MLSRHLFNRLVPCILCDETHESDQRICITCLNDTLASDIRQTPMDLSVHPHALHTMSLDKLSAVYVPFIYQWPVDMLISQYKYHASFDRSAVLLSLLKPVLDQIDFSQFNAIACVPNHPERTIKRGFNQLDYLTCFLAHQYQIPMVSSAIIRSKMTLKQAGLTAYKRRKNMSGAFAVERISAVENRHVLLIDDVITTGTTLSELAQTLLNQGVKRVSAFALAWAKYEGEHDNIHIE